jgi:hypothetical protein
VIFRRRMAKGLARLVDAGTLSGFGWAVGRRRREPRQERKCSCRAASAIDPDSDGYTVNACAI